MTPQAVANAAQNTQLPQAAQAAQTPQGLPNGIYGLQAFAINWLHVAAIVLLSLIVLALIYYLYK